MGGEEGYIQAVFSGELDDADLLDPNPDIVGLFCYYNEIYFEGKLQACTVEWSTNRMTLCAGICKYSEGSCAIRLSQPLLKFRPSSDVKETLLHEMIHAYLWLTNSNNDHDDHGPCFQKMMEAINASQAEDAQRPLRGYHITIYHSFSDEVNSYRNHHWKCLSCGDMVKRATNRAPSQKDCWQRMAQGNACTNEHCRWHRHQQLCGGEYEKVAEPEGYRDRRLRSRKSAVQLKDTSESQLHKSTSMQQSISVGNIEHEKLSRVNKLPGGLGKNALIDQFFPSTNKCQSREVALTGTEDRGRHSPQGHISSEENSTQKQANKRARRNKSNSFDEDDTCVTIDGGPKITDNSVLLERECTVIIGWKGWHAFEGEEDNVEVTEALKNKRSQRRMFERTSYGVADDKKALISLDSLDVPDMALRTISQVVDVNDATICLDSPETSGANDPVFADETLDKEKCRTYSIPDSDSLHKDIVRANGSNLSAPVLPINGLSSPISIGICPTDQGGEKSLHFGASHQPILKIEDSLATENISRGEVLCATEPINPKAQESFSNQQGTVMGPSFPASMFFSNTSSDSLNRNEQKTLEIKADKQFKSEDVASTDSTAGSSKVNISCKGRLQRQREDKEIASIAFPKQEPSVVCPVCQTMLFGNIEDAGFNITFNQHIDSCMSKHG
ncbi:hypothetical protein KP509_23G084000 [Ceratopteris richardii]|uniref:SprT-like domain-containing protein n=1 Tax=Ceratopteris richardii TaxID=49495 RepID=A0A8T2S2J8_CERRI|nr:hypothetical protein KP509_23G084000 [Ceratopteris richardii]